MTIAEQDRLLNEAVALTRGMRDAAAEVSILGGRRRKVWRALFNDGRGMRQTAIGRTCGVTSQTVWNEIHRED